eukprot:9483141-Pyramimonas_sp.AAC.1
MSVSHCCPRDVRRGVLPGARGGFGQGGSIGSRFQMPLLQSSGEVLLGPTGGVLVLVLLQRWRHVEWVPKSAFGRGRIHARGS